MIWFPQDSIRETRALGFERFAILLSRTPFICLTLRADTTHASLWFLFISIVSLYLRRLSMWWAYDSPLLWIFISPERDGFLVFRALFGRHVGHTASILLLDGLRLKVMFSKSIHESLIGSMRPCFYILLAVKGWRDEISTPAAPSMAVLLMRPPACWLLLIWFYFCHLARAPCALNTAYESLLSISKREFERRDIFLWLREYF